MPIVDLEAGAESAQGGFGMARFSDRLRAPSKLKTDAISFEISTPSGSLDGWGINLWAGADFTRSQVSAREISRSRCSLRMAILVASPFLARIDKAAPPASSSRPGTGPSPFYRTSKEGLRRVPRLRPCARKSGARRDA
jgi:hypothetical protein